ncbi:MAG: carboxypeptidase-like regulatory domain-containing protein, partial [Planctomycetota bacterium JB042]
MAEDRRGTPSSRRALVAAVLVVGLVGATSWAIRGDGDPGEVAVGATSDGGAVDRAVDAAAPADTVVAVERAVVPDASTRTDADGGDAEDDDGGALVGRVVDADGAPSLGWEVRAESDSHFAFADVGREGRFRFEELPADRYRLEAVHPLAPTIAGPAVDVVDGSTAEGTVVYDGPPIDRRLLVRTVVRPVDAHPPDPSDVVLHGPRGERRTGFRDPERGKTFVFDDVPPGLFTVTVDDPRFAPWRKDHVRPGRQVLAELEGRAAIVLHVVDSVSGRRLDRYSLSIENARESTRVKRADDPPPNGSVYDGLVAGPVTLRVTCDGYADRETELPPLATRERRTVRVELRPETSIHGVVLDATGAPVSGAMVLVSTEAGFSSGVQIEADGAGRFSFTRVRADRIALQAIAPHVAFPSDVVSLAVPRTRRVDGVQLRFPPAGVIRGSVVAGPAIDVDGLVLVALEPLRVGHDRGLFRNAWTSTTLGADGRFELAPLPYGEYALHLEMPPRGFGPEASAPWTLPSEIRHDLGAVALRGPVLDLRLPVDRPVIGRVAAVVRRHGRPLAGIDVRMECGFSLNEGAS